MKFRTEYIPEKAPFFLDPTTPVVLIGSCFSQNILHKMHEHKWEAINPCSTLYNPLSIDKAIDLMLGEEGLRIFSESLFKAGDLYHSRWFDSSFSSRDSDACMEEFRLRSEGFKKALSKGAPIIITFGTSIVYYLREESTPVGNCHKLPSSLFERKRLGVKEIVECWNHRLKELRKKYSDTHIIFTVSPVRHMKDGFIGNSRSKSVLLLALEEIINRNEGCFYFPAYEILNDDLRDYRFYASDLVHPSQEAVDYVWEKFKETFLNAAGIKQLDEGLKEVKRRNHRPMTGALGLPLA